MSERASEQTLTVTTAQGLTVEIELAQLGARSFAFVLDWHIRVLLALGWFLFGMLVIGGTEKLRDIFNADIDWEMVGYWVMLPSAAIYLFYHPLLEVLMHGSTPGKRMAGVRVVGLNGEPAGVAAILIRNVLRIVDSAPAFYAIGLICCALNRHHARIGDLAAGTLLAYDRRVDKDAFNLTQASPASALSLKQRALLLELLERWPELSDAVRIHAAATLLAKLGEPTIGAGAALLKSRLEAYVRG